MKEFFNEETNEWVTYDFFAGTDRIKIIGVLLGSGKRIRMDGDPIPDLPNAVHFFNNK